MLNYPFDFSDTARAQLRGTLTLDDLAGEPAPGATTFRTGAVALDNSRRIDLILAHSRATADFMYLRRTWLEPQLLDLLGLPAVEPPSPGIWLPGQVTLGAVRTQLVGEAMRDTLASPALTAAVTGHTQDEIVVLPVLREGAKYQIAEGLFDNFGIYCDEAILDSHHVFDPTVPRYSRRVETTILKDQDISPHQRRSKKLAIIGDSIASGVVMLGVLSLVEERFPEVRQIEIIAPFATLRGLARLAHYSPLNAGIRVHLFETILNALPPDYYYSAHFSEPEFHIRPDLEDQYREWWGRDAAGNYIADTACAGYGWAEAFFNPRKQIQMIDEQLLERHDLTIAEVVKRNL